MIVLNYLLKNVDKNNDCPKLPTEECWLKTMIVLNYLLKNVDKNNECPKLPIEECSR
jgi:hypothetical protein